MRLTLLFIFLLLLPKFILAQENNPQHAPDLKLIEKDVQALLAQSGLKTPQVKIDWIYSAQNKIEFSCHPNKSYNYQIKVHSTQQEVVSSVYLAVRKLGFLFPHPRIQITPKSAEILKHCDQSWVWKPILKMRGFHLHTQHAGEWTDAFFMNNQKIGHDTLWWLARNQQNLVQLQTLRLKDSVLKENLAPLIHLSHQLGIQFGLSFSFAMIQQKNYHLIPFWRALTGLGADEALRKKIKKLIENLDFDYVASELGTTEFTSINEENTLRWMGLVQEELARENRGFYIKSHVSSNQVSKKYGNFNFLTQYASPQIGVQAHTVFFYGLRDENTPMYGRKNFKDMSDFMLAQKEKRPVWYFPETSYYIAMDIDIPLFLADYLVARADDMKFLKENNFTGQVNFSTGQELGYWLFDWNLALLNDSDLKQDPLAGLKLLGEDPKVWNSILNWQTEYIKKQQLIQVLSSANLMDDLYPLAHKTHDRYLLREIKKNPPLIKKQIALLTLALKAKPDFEKVKNLELRLMLEVTALRMQHALKIREALLDEKTKTEKLEEARAVRESALAKMQFIERNYNRYPDSFVFQKKENVTSYPYGYGWPAVTLHFWLREEMMVKNNKMWNPFYMNIYNPFQILF
jgi:uncharacterized protein YneF (UPF0154 family)